MPLEAASGLWRSEDMTLLQLHMQREAAHDSVLKLGQLGMVQFQDLNKNVNAFARDFAAEVRRCDEMERKLRFLQEEITKTGIHAIEVELREAESMTLERLIDEKDAEVRELNGQFEALMTEKNRTREHLEVLSRDVGITAGMPGFSGGGLSMLTGVIPKAKAEVFERLIFRAARGNAFVRTDEIEEPFYNFATNEAVHKHVFAVFYSSARLGDKLRKIAEVSGASCYQYADRYEDLLKLRQTLKQQSDTLSQTLTQTANRRHKVLTEVAQKVREWRRVVVTEKSVYSVMNLMQFSGSTAVARGWCPVSQLDAIKNALRMAELSSGAQVGTVIEEIATRETRPTFFNTNKIISGFQGIPDSYGIARYKEINPGVFTVITFPYLFGVMYGDIGHGLILTLFAAFLIFMEKSWEGKPLNEIFAMIFGGRYLLFAMGLFAVYVGVLYNDMFGFSTEIFASGYTWPELPPYGPKDVVTPTSPNGKKPTFSIKPENPVVFGIDAAWSETENKLEFYNSVKMKCAVIIGIVQMTGGVFLSLMNHLYFGDMKAVWFRFIPEVVFISCTFGYMALMIVIKWCTTWENTHLAPSLLETMTNFFLAPGTVTVPLYNGQAGVQVVLLLVAFSMVPILLCAIPYLENKEHQEKLKKAGKHPRRENDHNSGDEELQLAEHGAAHGGGGHGGHGGDDEHFDFGEIMIHQIIHTIEYVLGCVSNTASYLRLWALSLAHAQLSDVFWNFAFMMTVGLDTGSGVFVFIGFAVWMSATIGVLLAMESLSAFLHSLRLHWVEFQSKFYYADGIKFSPFSLAEVLGDAL